MTEPKKKTAWAQALALKYSDHGGVVVFHVQVPESALEHQNVEQYVVELLRAQGVEVTSVTQTGRFKVEEGTDVDSEVIECIQFGYTNLPSLLKAAAFPSRARALVRQLGGLPGEGEFKEVMFRIPPQILDSRWWDRHNGFMRMEEQLASCMKSADVDVETVRSTILGLWAPLLSGLLIEPSQTALLGGLEEAYRTAMEAWWKYVVVGDLGAAPPSPLIPELFVPLSLRPAPEPSVTDDLEDVLPDWALLD